MDEKKRFRNDLFETFQIHQVNSVDESEIIRVIQERDLPFKIKRVYWMKLKKKDTIRGNHAHKKLRQFVVCISGQVEFHLEFNFTIRIQRLSEGEGIFVGPNTWRTFYATQTPAILLVLCDAEFQESDYIRVYEEFKEMKLHV